jgi:hypothetical protein
MKLKKVINKKVRNATTMSYYGITFKSKLELYCYKKLKETNLIFTYETVTFELIPSFEFKNDSYELFKKKNERYFGPQREHIRATTYTPDFVGVGWIIETKGNPNDAFPIKWKLFKKYLTDNKKNINLYMPRNQKQVDEVIAIIKQKNERVLQSKKGK